MPDAVWRRLTLNYAGFFLGLAALNEFVWRTQTDETWVYFRFPGMMIITVVFSIAHAPLLMKYVKAEELPLVVEVQSDLYHRALSSQDDDCRRRDRLESAGFVVIEVDEQQVWHRPTEVAARVRDGCWDARRRSAAA